MNDQSSKTDILMDAHWLGMKEPKLIGQLSAQQVKGKKAFSFEYDDNWIESREQILIDPDIAWCKGQQYPNAKENFGVFFDSMPDTWGRKLMKRREVQNARAEKRKIANLYDIDYLLNVYDEGRMGALRYKLEHNGSFLDDSKDNPTPPIAYIRELQYAANILETDDENEDINKWLSVLIASGSSLGGARPKANIVDEVGDIWIAKFPSLNDDVDKGAWEYLAYEIALKAGINMSKSRIEKVSGHHHTFFTKRFDRRNGERIHFASAMAMTGNNEDTIKEKSASYLDIAEFIQYTGGNVKHDLSQLWKRFVFNIAISNTYDHLRNHVFILTNIGWILSSVYDINPSIDKSGLALNIDSEDNSLNFDLAMSVGEYFQITTYDMKSILNKVKEVLGKWKDLAAVIGISRSE